MARKTNCERNGIKYFRKYATISGKRKMIYAESEKSWQAKVDEMKRNEVLGIIDTKKSVGAAMSIWMYTVMAGKYSMRKSSFSIYEGMYRNNIKEYPVMNMPLIDIKSVSVQAYIKEMVTQGKSANTIKEAHKVLNMFFKYAVSEGYILKNPCTNVTLPKLNDTKEIAVFSDDEIKKIRDALIDDRNRFLVLLALSTGARQGELLALKHSDMSGDSIVINKTQSLIRHVRKDEPTEYEFSDEPPKTKASYRTIPLTDSIKKEYKIHRALCQEEKLKRGQGRLNEDDYLFYAEMGNRCFSGNIQKRWKAILERAGVDYKNFHSLRHTYITKLVQAGINIPTVMQLAGHSKMATTLRYTHVEMEQKEKAVEIINALLK